MADFNKDEANKVLAITTENRIIGKFEEALNAVHPQLQARIRVSEIEAIYSKDFIFDVDARARVAKDFLGYREALARAAAESEALAGTLDGLISSSELQADLQKKKAVFQKKKAAFEALLGMISFTTNSMADFNKDKANKALETAIENTKIGKYEEALKSANEARLMDPELPDIKKLVTLLEVLSAHPGITHYEILRVEETANENEIVSAFRKLAVDLNPDTNSFPKASEAYCRISKAMEVLSRSKHDNNLVVACEARAPVAEIEADIAVKESKSDAPCGLFPKASEAYRKLSIDVLDAAARRAAPQEDSTHDVAARKDDASFLFLDPSSGKRFFTEPFSTDSSSTDSSSTDASSTDDSSTNASYTDDVGPGSKRASDAQATSTLHTPKKRREGHDPLNFK